MEPFNQFIVNLYWDGNITYHHGNITCDASTKRSSIVMRQRVTFEEFQNVCYNHVRLERHLCRISLFMFYQFQGMDIISEILGDDSLETMYFLASRDPQFWGHVLIKVDPALQSESPLITQQLQHFSFDHGIAPTDVSRDQYEQGHQVFPQQELPSATTRLADRTGRATVGGFELSTDECSSEHSEENQESSPVCTDDESDDVDDDVVPQTLQVPAPAIVTSQSEDYSVQELPEWAQDEDVDMWSASNGVIRVGMCFKGKKELDHAIRMWNVERGREIFIVDSTTVLYRAKCYSTHHLAQTLTQPSECRWLVRASKKKNNNLWQIYKWVDEHNCYGTVVRNNNRSLKSKVVATHVAHFIQQDVAYPVKHVQSYIKDALHVDISYQKAWHGRRKAIEGLFGSWDSNFQELPRYVSALERSNPNTVIRWQHTDNGTSGCATFKYVFWAFGPAIEAFRLCLPVICVDGTHLKGNYKGKMLTAVTKDANNHILSIAYAIVDEESTESWTWFLEHLRSSVICHTEKPVCIISDRHQGIINALQNNPSLQEPYAFHRYCLRHIRSNLMSRFKIFSLKRLCWAMGSTTHKRKYLQHLREMKSINIEAWNYLKAIGMSRWSLLHDNNHRRWGILTTNIAESMNNVLKVARLLPVTACIDHTFNKTIEHFRKHSEIAMNCNTPLPPRMWRLFSVRDRHAQEHNITEFNYIDGTYRVISKLTTNDSGGNDYTVEYKQRKCTCGKWQMTRFPCSHAIAVCRHRGEDVHRIVNKVYRTSTYRRQYRCDFQPLPHKSYWNDAGWSIRGDSAKFTNARGRRRARRIRNEMDMHYPEEPRVRRCTICKQAGHNRSRCPNSQPTYD